MLGQMSDQKRRSSILVAVSLSLYFVMLWISIGDLLVAAAGFALSLLIIAGLVPILDRFVEGGVKGIFAGE